ncbi:endothelial PAS domain-containing protein 1 [Dunckerocampus dactyliophorus]|uniref:endothelial PAS domain-containing protein 1 n=1 Tax=Dunckerocampus dactyliophorus TaxID=161453 RepID=UPI002406EAA5|nr:endothelial PAS domain-containing protein 1 [Dunckerocampus dactyliophorus]
MPNGGLCMRGVDGGVRLGSQDAMEKERTEDEISIYLRMLGGFVMVLSSQGDMMFLSENVSNFLGLTQAELMGHNVLDFTHPCDHQEIRSNLRLSSEERFWCGAKRDFVVRIKSTLALQVRSTNLRSTTWKVLHCQGRAKACVGPASVSCLLLTCQTLPVSHTLLSTHTFSSQHSMDMRFTHCDHRVMMLLGYSPHELVGRSIYELCHTLDTNSLSKYHVNLYLKSQSVSGQYRMLVRGGGYVWVESHSAVVPGVRSTKSRPCAPQPLCIFCVTYVLSGVEEPSLQLSLDQVVHHSLSLQCAVTQIRLVLPKVCYLTKR